MHDPIFLGPKAENADLLERLLGEVLHDHVFWRRNFHPGDPRLITEEVKRSERYDRSEAHLRDELFQILAELKRGAPLYSPRQVAHMVSDPTIPAIIGYFAGMLYNQNNVVSEAAPETVRKEREYVAALARMIGYPPVLPERLPPEAGNDPTRYAWGHLASGGTVANVEVLWLARNVRMYPLAVRLLADSETEFAYLGERMVASTGGPATALRDLSTFELLNLSISQVTALHIGIRAEIWKAGPEAAAAFEAALPSVRKAGLAGLLARYNERFPRDTARLPVLLMSQAAHYGWAKGLDIVGLGAAALRKLPVDEYLRLDMAALEEAIRASAAREEAVLMAVSICGTTEVGAVDPIHRVETLRSELAAEGLSFWHHVDGAFGGYLASMIPRDAAGRALAYGSAPGPGSSVLSEDVYNAVAAMATVDSVTIDPHKWGYIPYPAGALLCRDYHVRDAVAYAAPYIPTDETDGFGGFIGQWTLEGSRPGASAVSAYLSQAVLPLDPEGHGALVGNCVAANRALIEALRERFADGPVSLRLLSEPDTVGVCFALVPDGGAASVADLNAFTHHVWERVSVDGRENVSAYAFILSKTELEVGSYRRVMARMLPGLTEAEPDECTVMLLRSFMLNPFVSTWNERTPSFANQFADVLHGIASDAYPHHALRALTQRLGRRLRVAVQEADPDAPAAISRRLQHTPAFAAYLDVVKTDVASGGPEDADVRVHAAHGASASPSGDGSAPVVDWTGGSLDELVVRLVGALDETAALAQTS